ncbi:MAG TPA: metallophosphoesterase family protein [Candidatus Dormibacteraeota bacterium]|nr:metallophosphoesterase family protein [Candidatus Dormibacteraeota bacterium]
MATRLGVIADTHCPEFVDELPPSVFTALEGVDLILHAGDINAGSTIAALARIAPVQAVRGDHDRALPELPEARELTIEGKRIVLVHGQRSRWIEEPNTLLWTLSLGYFTPNRGLARSLHRRFPDADVIVYGHTHRSHAQRVGGALVFNPGAVHQWNPTTTRRRLAQRPGWFEWCWLQVARFMLRYPAPSVGILEIDEGEIVPRIVGL